MPPPPVVPPRIVSRPPAPIHSSQRLELRGRQLLASTSCQTRRSIAAHASTRGGRSAGASVMTVRRRGVRVDHRGGDVRQDALGPLGDDGDDRACRRRAIVMWTCCVATSGRR